MMKNAVITGVGIISPLGLGKDSLQATQYGGIAKALQAGVIPDFNELEYMDSKSSKYCQRAEKLALASSRLALMDAGFEFNQAPDVKFGVALGSMTSNLKAAAIFDQLVLRGEAGFCDPSLIPSGIMNSLSGIVSIKNRIREFHVPVAAGEASATQAIQFALMQLETGRVDAALAGGVEEICEDFRLTEQVKIFPYFFKKSGPEEEGQRSEEQVYPLSEAAAVLMLESADHAVQRGADVYAECIGFGSSYGADDEQITMRAALRALERTFRSPEIDPLDTDLIIASSNGHQAGGHIESEVLNRFFGCSMPEVLSSKSLLGDSLGASGALQVAAAALAIKNSAMVSQFTYSNAGLSVHPAQAARNTKEIGQVLISSFSDEGHMSFLVLRKVSAQFTILEKRLKLWEALQELLDRTPRV
jgi:3-oxoacyl-[acyl-carrier-protein] synthase II